MATNAIRFVALLLLALPVGTMFGIWVGSDPSRLSPTAYVEQQQNAINTLLPAVWAVCILSTATLAVLSRDDPRGRYLLAAAAACPAVAGLVTRLANRLDRRTHPIARPAHLPSKNPPAAPGPSSEEARHPDLDSSLATGYSKLLNTMSPRSVASRRVF